MNVMSSLSSSPNRSIGAELLSKFVMLTCLVVFVACVISGFLFENVWAWTAGLIYLAYDTWLLLFVLFQTFNLRSKILLPLPNLSVNQGSQHQEVDPDKNLSISVIIPSRNESLIIPNCLDALFLQTYPAAQILIVDDGSTDNSPQLLQQNYGIANQSGLVYSDRYSNLTVLRLGHQGKARALNSALDYIDADLIVTLDADTVISPDALQAFVYEFKQNPDLVAAGGVLQPVCRQNKSGRLFDLFFQFFQQFEYIFSFLSRAAWQKSNALLLVSGAFAAYRCDMLKTLNGFDPQSMVEDYELNHRIYRYAYQHQLSWTVGVVGQAYGVTDAPNGFKSFFHQRRRWFAGFLETQYNNLDMMTNNKFGRVGRFMLPIKMLDTVQPFFAVAAICILLMLVIQQSPAVYTVLKIIGAKIVLDLCFHLWGIYVYQRWTNIKMTWYVIPQMIFATIAAPFSFQIVKVLGACLGWWIFIRKQKNWLPQREI